MIITTLQRVELLIEMYLYVHFHSWSNFSKHDLSNKVCSSLFSRVTFWPDARKPQGNIMCSYCDFFPQFGHTGKGNLSISKVQSSAAMEMIVAETAAPIFCKKLIAIKILLRKVYNF